MRNIMFMLHFLGLAMALGSSITQFYLARKSSKLDKAEARKIHIHNSQGIVLGHIGLALLLLSGGYLMTPYWKILFHEPLLMAKLSLVVVLILEISILTVRARKYREGGEGADFRKVALPARLVLGTALLIVILAVLMFE
ncbi:MAG: hypothetical protein R2751_00835 [Bacteroidales bacterium]